VRARCPVLPLFLLASAPLSGQAPADRATLDRLQDSLATVDDTAALRASARSTPPDPLGALRAAFAAVRLATLGADPSAGMARDALRPLTRRHPDWPYAWHALALAEVHRAAWERADPVALGNRIGTGSLERALGYDERALAADPTYLPAALTLAALALDLRDTALYPGARDALRLAERAQARPPRALLLALGRLERAADAPDAALAAFERAAGGARVGGEPPGLALLELARTRLAFGAADGEAPYFTAAEADDSEVVAGFRADLTPIAADSELARFDAAPGAERARLLRRFWADRDRVELRAEGERLREHYRRLLYARRHFALTVSRRFYGGRDAYRSGSEALDDRGVIYVRHGEPATRLRPFVFGLMPNETWRYDRADGDLLFHFSAGYDDAGGGDLFDYRLVESVLDLHGAAGAPVDQLLLSRSTLTPLYGRMLHWGPNGAARARGRERAIGRVSIDYGTNTDSYELQFARRLTASANLIAVGQRDGVPLAHFVFGIGQPESVPVGAGQGEGVAYPTRVRVVALDGADRAVSSVDTVVVFRLDQPLAPGQYLIGRVELPVPPGRWTWRAAIAQGGEAGVVLPRDTVRAADSRAPPALSDLALGVRAASVRWERPGMEPVLLTPFDLFPERSELLLYYEAAGAIPGADYRHEIAVFRMKGDPAAPERRPAVSLRVDERAEGPVIRAHRTLQLRDLKAGRYLIEVRVRGPDGGEDVRRRDFRVVRPG
jgi:GWxTD domain-containing protein